MDFVMLRERSKSSTSLSRHFSPLLWGGNPRGGGAREFRKEEEEAPTPTRWGKTSVVRETLLYPFELICPKIYCKLAVSREFSWNVVKPFLLEICYFSLSLDRGVSCRGWVSSFYFSFLSRPCLSFFGNSKVFARYIFLAKKTFRPLVYTTWYCSSRLMSGYGFFFPIWWCLPFP